MKSASVVQLLKVGHLLFQKQQKFKKCFGVRYDVFRDEIHSLLHVILMHMGIVRSKAKSLCIVNAEHFEYVTNMFWNYCKDLISEEEMIDLIHVLKMDEVLTIEVRGKTVTNTNSIEPIHVLIDLRNLLQLKRAKLNKLIDGISDIIRAELNHTPMDPEGFGEIR